LDARRRIVPVLGIGVLGAFLQIAGANWDVSSHILGIVDTFYTPPHLVIYVGILLVLIAGLLGVWMARGVGDEQLRPLFSGFRVSMVGSVIQLIAGPLDLWWHSTYGFDPFLFTPTHSMLIVGLALGGVGMVIGVVRLLQADGTRVARALVVLALGTLWLDINFIVLWLVNAQGIAYTFGICSPKAIYARSCSFVNTYETVAYMPALFLDALGGTSVILLANRILGRRGVLTMIAAIAVTVYAVPDLGYSAYMLLYVGVPGSFYFTRATEAAGANIAAIIPFYLAVLVPMAALDVVMKQDGKRLLVASLFAGPLSVFLDGRFSIFSGLWSPEPQTLIYLVPMVLAGLLGVRLNGRMVNSLTSAMIRSTLGELP